MTTRPDQNTHGNPASPNAEGRHLWVMLFALTAAFTLSQAYRTVGAIMAAPLQNDFHLSAQGWALLPGPFISPLVPCSCSWA